MYPIVYPSTLECNSVYFHVLRSNLLYSNTIDLLDVFECIKMYLFAIKCTEVYPDVFENEFKYFKLSLSYPIITVFSNVFRCI